MNIRKMPFRLKVGDIIRVKTKKAVVVSEPERSGVWVIVEAMVEHDGFSVLKFSTTALVDVCLGIEADDILMTTPVDFALAPDSESTVVDEDLDEGRSTHNIPETLKEK